MLPRMNTLRWHDLKPSMITEDGDVVCDCRQLLTALQAHGTEVIKMDAARRLQYSSGIAQRDSGCSPGEEDKFLFLPEMLIHKDLSLEYFGSFVSPDVDKHPGLADAYEELVRLGAPLHGVLHELFRNIEHIHEHPLWWAQVFLLPVIKYGRGDELIEVWGPKCIVEAVSYFDSPPCRAIIRHYGEDTDEGETDRPPPPASVKEVEWLVSVLRRCGAKIAPHFDAAAAVLEQERDRDRSRGSPYAYLWDSALLRLRNWHEAELRWVRFLERSLEHAFPQTAAMCIAGFICGPSWLA